MYVILIGILRGYKGGGEGGGGARRGGGGYKGRFKGWKSEHTVARVLGVLILRMLGSSVGGLGFRVGMWT